MLQEFLDKAEKDVRLSPIHICLFVTLWNLKKKKGSGNSLSFFSSEVKLKSRIQDRGTYYRTLKELDSYGYLRYAASFNHCQGSQIIFPNKTNRGVPKQTRHL